MSCTFYKGDCHKLIQQIPANSLDLIYFDPPFGTTRNFWDDTLDWKLLFAEFFRVLKDTGTLVIHCSVPFNYTLIRAAPNPPNYSWYWKKDNVTNPYLAKIQPLRNTEEILVWTKKKTIYYPQRIGTEEIYITGKKPKYKNSYYGSAKKTTAARTEIGRLQTHFIDMKRKRDKFSTRPDELVELIYKSYTKPGDKVLDPTCFGGMSGVIAKRLGLHWTGFDLYHLPYKLIETNIHSV